MKICCHFANLKTQKPLLKTNAGVAIPSSDPCQPLPLIEGVCGSHVLSLAALVIV